MPHEVSAHWRAHGVRQRSAKEIIDILGGQKALRFAIETALSVIRQKPEQAMAYSAVICNTLIAGVTEDKPENIGTLIRALVDIVKMYPELYNNAQFAHCISDIVSHAQHATTHKKYNAHYMDMDQRRL